METMENDEEIQQKMAETRASLADKLETLEQKVVGTVTETTTAVNETVDVIKDSVQETVTAVNETVRESVETVKDWFDLPAHVREHPWLTVGGSVAVGFCLGTALGKAAPTYANYSIPNDSLRTAYYGNAGIREEQPVAAKPQTPTPSESAWSKWSPEIDKLKGLALGVLFGTVREMIASSVSEQVGDHLKEIIDSATKKVGGEPIPSSAWTKNPKQPSTHNGEGGEETETPTQSALWQDAPHAPVRRW